MIDLPSPTQTDIGGYLLFYTGSFAYASAEPIIADWARTAQVDEVASFKTLRVFRKTAERVRAVHSPAYGATETARIARRDARRYLCRAMCRERRAA